MSAKHRTNPLIAVLALLLAIGAWVRIRAVILADYYRADPRQFHLTMGYLYPTLAVWALVFLDPFSEHFAAWVRALAPVTTIVGATAWVIAVHQDYLDAEHDYSGHRDINPSSTHHEKEKQP